MRRAVWLLGAAGALFSAGLGAQEPEVERGVDDLPRIFPVEDYDGEWITGDTNGDGVVDYALQVNDEGRKRYEVMDFNNDGRMDDFYFYRNGVLWREELDTNFDGAIDLWVFMHDGVRIAGYDRDTDFDGVIDQQRRYGEEE